jgi:hypothetical protein
MKQLKEFLGRASSRKFLLAFGTVVLIVLNKRYNLGFDEADIYTIAGVVSIYVGVQGSVDYKEAVSGVKKKK